jgi:lipid-A-disaccharide synthase-like uncharacterized protein
MGDLLGYVGLSAIILCWVPQTIETIKAGRCGVNKGFLVLSLIGNISLTLYALQTNDRIFFALNSLASIGSFVNSYYKFFPRGPG